MGPSERGAPRPLLDRGHGLPEHLAVPWAVVTVAGRRWRGSSGSPSGTDTAVPVLDLGAGEVAGQLAWVDHLLGDRLDVRWPGLRPRLRAGAVATPDLAAGSRLDLLGPWPWYLLAEAVLVAEVWALMTWPWVRRRRLSGAGGWTPGPPARG